MTTVPKDRTDTEGQLIDRIAKSLPAVIGRPRRRGPSKGLHVAFGIGADAAIVSPDGRSDWILTCDAFIEGVHFLREMHAPDSVGYKSLVRASSDIAAMGAIPRAFLLTLALPRNLTSAWLDRFLSGMRRAARRLDVLLIGGDTTAHSRVFISITVLGDAPRGRALTRSAARPGDTICVSGRLGRAQLGLELLRAGAMKAKSDERQLRPLLRQHLYPDIRLELGAWIAQRKVASAMMDISDGLSTDLARLCKASGVGAKIESQRIPRVKIPQSAARKLRGKSADALRMALHGGEDYELLFTVPKRNAAKLRGSPGFSELTAIGEITRERKILLVDPDGRTRPLEPRGWDPFRK